MKRFFTVVGALYVCFSILCAYSYSRPSAPVVANNQGEGTVVATTDGRLGAAPPMVRGTYSETARVIVYSIPGCSGCADFKRDAVPKLIAEGILTEIIDASVKPPQDKTITSFPTIIVYDGDKEVKRFVGNAPVSVVLEAVPLAPEPIEPPDYIIWFWPWR